MGHSFCYDKVMKWVNGKIAVMIYRGIYVQKICAEMEDFMANLAIKETKRVQEKENILYKQGNVVYGCFRQKREESERLIAQNMAAMLRESTKAGILFGIRLFGSCLVGMVMDGSILEWQNVRPEEIPVFAIVLLFAACSGGVFCLSGMAGNLWNRFFSFWQ